MANCYRIIITLFVLAALSAQPACGETNSFTNHIDFSGFYREWQVSPSNALVQITPALMELAASVKTNGIAPNILHNSLWHLFSTNTPYAGDTLMMGVGKRSDYFKMSQRSELVVTVFTASVTCATPQEEIVMGFAKTLAFMRNAHVPGFPFPIEFLDKNAYDAMVRKLIENGASEQDVPEIYLTGGPVRPDPKLIIKPSGRDPEEAWILYERFLSLYDELSYASRKVCENFVGAAIGTRNLPQEERDRICIEVLSMQMLSPDEERSIETAFSTDPWGLGIPIE